MPTKPLEQRQLFNTSRQKLEERFLEYYAETEDSAYIIECALSVQVRNAYSKDDFSFFMKDFIRSLFLTGQKLPENRNLHFFFRDYFTNDEWSRLITRLFESPEEYLFYASRNDPILKIIGPYLSSGSREVTEEATLIAQYKDGAGKRKLLKIRGIDRKAVPSRHSRDILYIMTFLSRFQKNGIKSFAKIVNAHTEYIVASYRFDKSQPSK
ncbi:hypothetical protein [Candidatus Enterococcus ferrettii]|uniref:Uncharacterized protein n=1 Tax=Candidatus Enterococcus ferrettii TaxID=2815324 RepID=A0ABV0ESK8_9ENTE|nr:hypothetical protein [Enterococcus sp. 665A]MBO1342357.1 hypothetical protein [Enterococcus sp. 665A]